MSRLKPWKVNVFDLVFTNNTILLCFFLFFLIIDQCFVNPAVIVQIFNLTEEVAIPIGTPTNKARSEIETHPVIVETKRSKFSCNSKSYKRFCSSYSLNHFVLFLLRNNVLFHLFS